MFQTYKPILVWSVLAILIGIIVGALDALFGRVLLALSSFRTEHFLYLIPFLAIAWLLFQLSLTLA